MALSKRQSKRLGSILSVIFNEDCGKENLEEVIKDGFVEKVDDQKYRLTDAGQSERRRLSTLAGLNLQYSAERKEENS
mgnify:CR=1 FL=1